MYASFPILGLFIFGIAAAQFHNVTTAIPKLSPRTADSCHSSRIIITITPNMTAVIVNSLPRFKKSFQYLFYFYQRSFVNPLRQTINFLIGQGDTAVRPIEILMDAQVAGP